MITIIKIKGNRVVITDGKLTAVIVVNNNITPDLLTKVLTDKCKIMTK